MLFRQPCAHSAEWRVLGQIRNPYPAGGLDVHRTKWGAEMAVPDAHRVYVSGRLK